MNIYPASVKKSIRVLKLLKLDLQYDESISHISIHPKNQTEKNVYRPMFIEVLFHCQS